MEMPLHTMIGNIPAGRYKFSLELNSKSKLIEAYHGIRLFFAEKSFAQTR